MGRYFEAEFESFVRPQVVTGRYVDLCRPMKFSVQGTEGRVSVPRALALTVEPCGPITGRFLSQLFPFYDDTAIDTLGRFETAMYQGI